MAMVDEFGSQFRSIGARLFNIGTTTHTRAKRQWRKVLFSIYFSNNMLSISKVPKTLASYLANEIIASPSDIASSSGIIRRATTSNDDIDGFRKNIGRADLNDLMKSKNMETLISKFNGVRGLAKSLETTLEHGIISNDVERRKVVYGSNTLNKPPMKRLFSYAWESLRNATIGMLIVCASLSLKENGSTERWNDGCKIFIAFILALVVSVIPNFVQERQFHHLSKTGNDIKMFVKRNGRRQEIFISDMVVGDVVILNIGDQIPAYGLLINGNSLLVDQSSMTGDVDPIEVDPDRNPFLCSGSKVAKGHGRMLVISVGVNATWGKMNNSTTYDTNEQTPLQSRIMKLTSSIVEIGIVAAILVPLIMLIRHLTGYTNSRNKKLDCQGEFTDTMDKLNSLTRILIASTENIPLALTITLAYCRRKMLGDRLKARNLSACEKMGSTTVICTGKTGTLTMNQMEVTKCWIGFDCIKYYSSVNSKVLQLYHQAVGLNTSGNVYNSLPGMTPEYWGSPTEKALLSWGVTDLSMDMEKLRKDSTTLDTKTFNSKKKKSGVSIRNKEDGTIHVYWKGAAEIILEMCSNYYQKNGVIMSIHPEEKTQFAKIIQRMAENGLRCIAFAHREKCRGYYTNYKMLNEEGLTLLGIVGIKDPCRLGVKEAVNTCWSAGVNIKLITGDNVDTAIAISRICGILKPGHQVRKGEVVTGEEFRNYKKGERMKKIDNIRIIARSSPSDKGLIVECLKKKGHVVAVIGHDTHDAPALKKADIGLSMGIHGSEVVKESSDIVILDDDFGAVAKALKWGRCAHDNIQKFAQFQVTMNIPALVINFVAASFATDAPLTVVQMLWINIIMDIFGAVALTTEQLDIELMRKPPVGRGSPFVTNIMWRNILAQAVYQVVILLTIHFRGISFFKVSEEIKNTIIFNSFVLCNVFNLFNSRKLEKRKIFKGLHKNGLFLSVIGVIVFIQVLMVQYLNKFAETEKLTRNQWGICMGVAFVSGLIGWFVKSITVPSTSFQSYIQALF